MNKSVLVTGGTGFIGSYICRYLVKGGYTPIVLIRKSSSLTLLEDIKDKLKFVEGDLFDLVLLEDLMQQADYVIHSAALLSFKPADRDAIFKTNVEGTANLVNLALLNGIKKFVHISSVSAFGKSKKERTVNERSGWVDSSLNSNYGISKNLAEREIYRGCAEGLDAMVLCPSLVIGAGNWLKGTPSLIDRIARGTPFYLLGSNGVVDVRDVADLAVKALKTEIDDPRVIVSGENVSSRVFTTKFAKELGARIPTIPLTKWLGKLACLGDYILSFFTVRDRLLTLDSLKTTFNKVAYDNTKSRQALSHQYIPLDQSIKEISECYLESMQKKRSFGILEIK